MYVSRKRRRMQLGRRRAGISDARILYTLMFVGEENVPLIPVPHSLPVDSSPVGDSYNRQTDSRWLYTSLSSPHHHPVQQPSVHFLSFPFFSAYVSQASLNHQLHLNRPSSWIESRPIFDEREEGPGVCDFCFFERQPTHQVLHSLLSFSLCLPSFFPCVCTNTCPLSFNICFTCV